jgi:hypothetical protein
MKRSPCMSPAAPPAWVRPRHSSGLSAGVPPGW